MRGWVARANVGYSKSIRVVGRSFDPCCSDSHRIVERIRYHFILVVNKKGRL